MHEAAGSAPQSAQDLGGPGRDHLVDVHVVRGSGPGLVGVDHELVGEGAAEARLAGPLDRPPAPVRVWPHRLVGARGGERDAEGGFDQPRLRAEAPAPAHARGPSGAGAGEPPALPGPSRPVAGGTAGHALGPGRRAAGPAAPRRPAAEVPAVALRPAAPSPLAAGPAEVAGPR